LNPSSEALNGQEFRRHQNDETIKKYIKGAARFIYMTLRYTECSPSEDVPLKIIFLPSQVHAATALHTLLHNKDYSTIDTELAKELIHTLLSSLFFPQDGSHEKGAVGRHNPINCFFLATSIQDNGKFRPPQSVTPRINEMDFVLRLVACQELASDNLE
jgi:hypothetical protein